MRSFREWTLAELDRTFNLIVLDNSPVLKSWLGGPIFLIFNTKHYVLFKVF
jgi:hypothetical protein